MMMAMMMTMMLWSLRSCRLLALTQHLFPHFFTARPGSCCLCPTQLSGNYTGVQFTRLIPYFWPRILDSSSSHTEIFSSRQVKMTQRSQRGGGVNWKHKKYPCFAWYWILVGIVVDLVQLINAWVDPNRETLVIHPSPLSLATLLLLPANCPLPHLPLMIAHPPLADGPAMSFVFECWQINMRNTNQLGWAIN